MTIPPAKILIVEDDRQLLALMRINLELAGHTVLIVSNGPQGVALAAQEQPDLILLDIRLPGMNGLDVCRQIRRFSSVPIIMISARTAEENIVEGLDTGADDYLAKPFGESELAARVNAHLRRRQLTAAATHLPDVVTVGALRIDRVQHRVYQADQEVNLTAIEYRLLDELATHLDHVLTAETLLYNVWGVGYEEAFALLRQSIHRLRQKIEVDARRPRLLLTRPGQGYLLVSHDRAEAEDEW